MAAEEAIRKRPIKLPVRDLYRRVGGVPLQCGPQNIVYFVRSREVSGPMRTRDPTFAHIFKDLDIVRSQRGHLQPVIQIHYDSKCIHYVTLCRDGLVKVWKVHDGRLLGAYRSDVEEICDIALSHDDRFLIGVSDSGIAIWNFKTRALLAVLFHIENISRVFFMTKPKRQVKHFAIVTKEAQVKFFEYIDLGPETGIKFDDPKTNLIVFAESSKVALNGMTAVTELSPCGRNLFVGLRYVRVFSIHPTTGPQIILNVALTEGTFVTVMSWSNAGDRFLTTTTEMKLTNLEADDEASNKEITELWHYSSAEGDEVDRKALDLSCFKREKNRPVAGPGQKWGASALCWDAFDKYFLTANKLGVIQVWDPITCRVVTETFVEDRIEYLVAHPIEKGIIVSAGVDSIIILWDMLRLDYDDNEPTAIVSFTNKMRRVPNTYTRMLWSNDGTVFLVADVECYVTTYARVAKQNGVAVNTDEGIPMPKELFFHTDFRPLVRDPDGRLLDKEARLPPHLVPPPFLVDREGNPYPPAVQRLVPGRQHCNDAELTPGFDVLYSTYKNTNFWSPKSKKELEQILSKYWEESDSILAYLR